MKKRGLAAVLCLCVVAMLLPIPAMATPPIEGTVKVTGVDVTKGGFWLNNGADSIKKSTDQNNYNVAYNPFTGVLTLKDAVLSKSGTYMQEMSEDVYTTIYAEKNLIIELIGTSTVTVDANKGYQYAIYNNGNCTIQEKATGSGSLTATAKLSATDEQSVNRAGIYTTGTLTIESGAVTAIVEDGGNETTNYGIHSGNDLIIENGTVDARTGTGNCSYGLFGNYNVYIQGGTVIANGGDAANYSCAITTNNDNVYITGGNVTANSGKGTGAIGTSYGIFAREVTINNSTVTATAKPAAFRSYAISTGSKSLTIGENATVTATGGDAPKSYGLYAQGGTNCEIFLNMNNTTVTAKSGTGETSKALSVVPQPVAGGEAISGKASTDATGTPVVDYSTADIDTYKYVKLFTPQPPTPGIAGVILPPEEEKVAQGSVAQASGSAGVLASKLNVRAGAGTDTAILGWLNRGDTVKILSIRKGWVKIPYEDTVGYVSLPYLSQLTISGIQAELTVACRNLNVRQEPSLTSAVTGKLTRGKEVLLDRCQDGWGRLDPQSGIYAGQWISLQYLR